MSSSCFSTLAHSVSCLASALFAVSPELPKDATVQIKTSELDKEWQVGTVDITKAYPVPYIPFSGAELL